jgi:hypothetical protein
MGDFNDIERLFQNEMKLPQFKTKRWIIIPDSNKNNYNDHMLIKYNCKDHKDKLVAYHNGYIKIKGYIESTSGTPLQANDDIAFRNGSYSIIDDCKVKIENNDIDHSKYNYLTMTVLNLFEYSNDYGISIAESYGFVKDIKNVAGDNTGHSKRKLFLGTFAAAKFPFVIKIPTSHISPFFRRLSFPIINHTVEIELNVANRLENCLLRAAGAQKSKVTIETTELVLPVVELSSDYDVKFMNKLKSRSFPQSLDWEELKVYEIANMSTGQINYEIDSAVCGINRLFVLAIHEDNWEKQTNVDTFMNTTLTNINVVLDGDQFYPQNINDDEFAHELLKECFNNGGGDNDKGTCLTYLEWKTCYKIYAFVLSRQKVLESDPRKAQSLRFKCNLPAGNYKLIFIVCCKKHTDLDFCNSYNLKNI